jgi:pyrroline-5-carboxylate reductase
MNITFLGGGNMASALVAGLIDGGVARETLTVIERVPETATALAARFGIATAPVFDPKPACDVLILALKPQQMPAALKALPPLPAACLVISVAAGLRVAALSGWLRGHAQVVRAMPNTPALIGRGLTGLYASEAVQAQERQKAETILAAVGRTVWVENEAQMDAITAVSGSGPAYLFHFIEAMEAAALHQGFTPSVARLLALETTVGAALLAAQSPEAPALLRARVTSPGGTTEAALKVLNEKAWLPAMDAAIEAACHRAHTLGDELGAAK